MFICHQPSPRMTPNRCMAFIQCPLFFCLDELIAYELKRREAERARRPPPEVVRARIPFSACLQAFSEPENVEDFWSSALQAKSAGVK